MEENDAVMQTSPIIKVHLGSDFMKMVGWETACSPPSHRDIELPTMYVWNRITL